jgi:hypothetical protein
VPAAEAQTQFSAYKQLPRKGVSFALIRAAKGLKDIGIFESNNLKKVCFGKWQFLDSAD